MRRLDRRVLLVAAVIVVVLGAAQVSRRRGRRRADALGAGWEPTVTGSPFERPPEPVAAGPAVVAPLALTAGAAVDAVPVEAADDLDAAGAGLPVPAEQAVQELRVETRFETVVFVRAMLILVGIAVLLTARTILVH